MGELQGCSKATKKSREKKTTSAQKKLVQWPNFELTNYGRNEHPLDVGLLAMMHSTNVLNSEYLLFLAA
jgi:hypothetical protein